MIIRNNILELLKYNYWANKRILSMIPEDALDIEMKSSFPTIRKTVYHSWDAESIWFTRLKGGTAVDWPSVSFTGTFADALNRIFGQEQELISWAEGKDDDFYTSLITYKNTKGMEFTSVNFHILQHMVNHSTFHRGQVITMLRETGTDQGFPSTDLITYYRDSAQS